jgi:hypothetical protein
MTGAPAGPGPVPAALADWERRACVRTAPWRTLDPLEPDRVYFPAWAAPHLVHPLVAALDAAARERLAIDYLYQYLLFTVCLEVETVNDVVGRMATGAVGDLPAVMRAQALGIYCDEAYHAVANMDLLEQVAAHTGVPVPQAAYGEYEDVGARLAGIGRRLLPADPGLAAQLRVIVFETVVTSILSEIPEDPAVYSAIRDVVRDHARDERRHHAFFMRYLTLLWPRLPEATRPAAAATIPELINACLRWDTGPVRDSLDRAGLAPGQAAAVIADSYSEQRVVSTVRRSARHLIQRCVSLGMTELPRGAEAFRRCGLIDAGGR